MKLILFDFDKTLTFTDTLLPLSYYLCKHSGKRSKYFKTVFNYLLFRLSFRNELTVKRNFCNILVKGKRTSDVNNIIKEFFNSHALELFNPAVTKILESEKNKGNHCYIISSNFNFFLNPLKEILNIKGIESTQAEIINDVYTGLIDGNNCSKSEKWERAKLIKINFNYDEINAYGDSAGDFDMLKNSDKAFLIRLKTKNKSDKIKTLLYYLIGKVYKPDYETKIIKIIT